MINRISDQKIDGNVNGVRSIVYEFKEQVRVKGQGMGCGKIDRVCGKDKKRTKDPRDPKTFRIRGGKKAEGKVQGL